MSPRDLPGWQCQNCTFHHDVSDCSHCLMCGQARRYQNLPATSPKEQSSCHVPHPQHKHLTEKRGEEGQESEDSLIAHLRQPDVDDADDADQEQPSKPEVSTLNFPQHHPKEGLSSSSSSSEPQQLSTTHLPQHTSDDTQHQQQENEELQGDETFLVGMTPQYWAHVPMLIDDILNHLTLSKGGINFLEPHHIPVSKCLLVGRIIWANQTSDNTMAYVIDDGTGLMDCVCYHNHNDSVYELPSLLPTSNNDNENENTPGQNCNVDGNFIYNIKRPIPLGTCVKIFGKIKNLAISHGRVVREVNAQLIEPVQESFGKGNPEHEHWSKCAKFLQVTCQKCPILQPLGCLELLGDRIQSQVRAKRRLPSADDTLGAWRVFGTQCRCMCCQSIKDSLLYCHCQAKVVDGDQQFQFRDAMLKHLLHLQTKHAKKLVFNYQYIKQEESLLQVAMEQAAKSGDDNNDSKKMKKKKTNKFFQEELVRSTVRALVKDGILFHIDQDNDQYLLVTREKVLEPFVRDELERTGNTKNFVSLKGAPVYLQGVDLEKFMYIKRCLVHDMKENATKEAKRQKVVAN